MLVEHLRRVDLLIVVGEAPAHVGDERLEQGPALRVPEDRAGRFLLHVEEVHLARELAMVAPLGFLDLLEIRVERLLAGEGGPVDARQHRLGGIAAPIGARRPWSGGRRRRSCRSKSCAARGRGRSSRPGCRASSPRSAGIASISSTLNASPFFSKKLFASSRETTVL